MCLPKKSFGFTLVELLIVVSIIVIVSGAVIPSFLSYISNQDLIQAREQLRSDLRSAQNRALTGSHADEIIGADLVKYWGVKFFGDNNYMFFVSVEASTAICTTPASYIIVDSLDLSSDMTINQNGCMFFDMATAGIITPVVTSPIIITNSKGDTEEIIFNSQGYLW